jgi:hypothetical protein
MANVADILVHPGEIHSLWLNGISSIRALFRREGKFGMRISNIKQRDGRTPDTGCEMAWGISRHIGRTEEQTEYLAVLEILPPATRTESLPGCSVRGSITSASASLGWLRRLLWLLRQRVFWGSSGQQSAESAK